MSEFDYSIYNKNKDKPEGFKKTDSKLRAPMSREQRAKQFAPFDALTGGDSCNRFLYYQLKMSMRCSRRNGFPARIRIF
jgi:hypothetical protein